MTTKTTSYIVNNDAMISHVLFSCAVVWQIPIHIKRMTRWGWEMVLRTPNVICNAKNNTELNPFSFWGCELVGHIDSRQNFGFLFAVSLHLKAISLTIFFGHPSLCYVIFGHDELTIICCLTGKRWFSLKWKYLFILRGKAKWRAISYSKKKCMQHL